MARDWSDVDCKTETGDEWRMSKSETSEHLARQLSSIFFFFQYCAGQRFIAALSHTGGQARKN